MKEKMPNLVLGNIFTAQSSHQIGPIGFRLHPKGPWQVSHVLAMNSPTFASVVNNINCLPQFLHIPNEPGGARS